MLSTLSESLTTKVQDILDNHESQNFRIECRIAHTENSEIDIEVPFLNSLTIDQGFSTIYTDNIEMVVQFTVKDYMTLINNHQNLFVVLQFIYVDVGSFEDIIERPVETYQYRCIIKNTEDLTKKYHVSQIQRPEEEQEYNDFDSMLFDVHFQLLEDTAFRLRHKEVNFILHDVTVLQCMRYIAKLYGIGNIYIEPPDNTSTIPHIIVSPPRGFTDVFDYIQYTYGVYNTGLEYYFHGDVLYVYKAYDTDPDSRTTFNLYNVQKGSYPGLAGYHYIKGDETHILSNTGVNTTNLTELAIENKGNSSTFIRADTLIDKYVTTANGSGTTVDTKNVLSCELTTDKGMSSGAILNKHILPTSNIYAVSSDLAKHTATVVVLGWIHSKPFALLPGQKVLYHFDDDEYVYNYKSGRCEYIAYQIKPLSHGGTSVYSCNAIMSLRLSI